MGMMNLNEDIEFPITKLDHEQFEGECQAFDTWKKLNPEEHCPLSDQTMLGLRGSVGIGIPSLVHANSII